MLLSRNFTLNLAYGGPQTRQNREPFFDMSFFRAYIRKQTNKNFMKTFQKIWVLGVICWYLAGCSAPQEEQRNTSTEDSSYEELTDIQADVPEKGSNKRVLPGGDSMSQARLMGFDIERDLPLLYEDIKEDPNMKRAIEAYGTAVMTGKGIKNDEDILALLKVRDDKLIPYLHNVIESRKERNPSYVKNNSEQLEKELNLLGLQMTFAEGNFTGLGAFPFMQEWIEKYASEGLKLYTRFQVADAQSQNGEYLYLNMKPVVEKVVLGEELASLPDSTYFKKIEETYEKAILTLTDIHKVYNPNNRQEESFLVKGISTDLYPNVTENKTREAFTQNKVNSRYSKMVEKILENPSEISNKPEQVYVIVTEWLDTEQMAQKRVIGHLRKGEDVPHYLPIEQGDGKIRYAVTYRFFENEEKANQAFEKIEKSMPSAELVYCSVRGKDLYQLGPSNSL